MSEHAHDCDGLSCDAWERAPWCIDSEHHRWTSEGCGGSDKTPGVWSLGGTRFRINRRCERCGMAVEETHYGAQRGPGECDTRTHFPHAYGVRAVTITRSDALGALECELGRVSDDIARCRRQIARSGEHVVWGDATLGEHLRRLQERHEQLESARLDILANRG